MLMKNNNKEKVIELLMEMIKLGVMVEKIWENIGIGSLYYCLEYGSKKLEKYNLHYYCLTKLLPLLHWPFCFFIIPHNKDYFENTSLKEYTFSIRLIM